MKFELKTEILIHASSEKIWSILTNFEKYPEWNPFVKSLQGEVKVGEKIKVELPSMNFKPKVLIYKKENEFTWLGHFLFPGLFDGRHQFYIKDNANGTCTFYHSEKFAGILVPIFKKTLETKIIRGFEEMSLKLKLKSEE